MKEVTLVITACDRNDLLEITLRSFVEFNKYPIVKLLIKDDSGLLNVRNEMIGMLDRLNLPFPYEVLPLGQDGQAKSIDMLMDKVETEYVFHCEDDWQFYNSSFIEKSLEIMESDEKILQVWIRDAKEIPNVNYGELQTVNGVDFHLVLRDKDTSGFTCNPHLKRKKDYVSYTQFLSEIPDGRTEHKIGDYYYYFGFRSAWLIEGDCRHIGDEKSTYRPSSYRQGARKL